MLISEGDVDFAFNTWKVSFLTIIKADKSYYSLRRCTDIIVELRRDAWSMRYIKSTLAWIHVYTKPGTGIYRMFTTLQDFRALISKFNQTVTHPVGFTAICTFGVLLGSSHQCLPNKDCSELLASFPCRLYSAGHH